MFNKCKKGMSLVYVMVCLIIIGLTATALIKMSHKNALVQITYSQSESARLAVHAGFDKALAFFENEDTGTVLPLLRAWIDKPQEELTESQRWIIGTPKSYDSLYSDCQYKVQLLGFDTATFSISLYSEGLTKQGNRASAFGTYALDGLGFSKENNSDARPTNALHLGQGAGEIIAPLKVMKGDTWVDNPKSYFAGPGTPHEFYGLFMTSDRGGNTMQIKSAIFHDKAYIRCPIKIDGNSFTVKNGIGLEQSINTTQPVTVKGGDIYFNGDYKTTGAGAGTAGIHLYNNSNAFFWEDQKFNSSPIATGFVTKDATTHEINDEKDSIVNIKERMKITKAEPPEIIVDIDIIPESYRYKASDISGGSPLTADHLNRAYGKKTLWNDFLVITGNPYVHNSVSSSGTLNCKVIWILESAYTLVSNSKMFTMSDNALMLLYLGDTKVNYFKLGSKFRGFIYSDGSDATENNKHIFQASSSEVHGGILIKDRIFRMESNGGDFRVYYDTTALNAFDTLGLFKLVDDVDTTDGESTLIMTADRIESELLSRSF